MDRFIFYLLNSSNFVQLIRMGRVKQFFLQLDLFAHPQFLRYRQEPGYRTLTGGIISSILVIIFATIFASLAIDTFQNNLIVSSTTVSYGSDPQLYTMITSPTQKFMFAVGIVGLDLSASQRYFDITLEEIIVINNTKNTIKVPLSPCKLSQWSGVSDEITQTYYSLNFTQWLCPPQGFTFPLQGKKTSNAFKYAKLTVLKCGTAFNSSTCVSSAIVDNFINLNQGATVNFYYINPNINSGDKDYLNYYLQDSNYFTFNTNTGVNANLFYSQYSIQTDHSIFPWQDNGYDKGLLTVSPANTHVYTVSSNNQYAKIYLRKSSEKLDISRSYQKLDESLAYIGGLLGTVILLMAFMSIYSKFCYEIEFGDKLFKQNENGNYGSQHFNFIVYLGYGIFNILTMFGIIIDWKIMKKYHQCRIQTLKQLDMQLLFKKIEHFQEVSKIVLDDHHIKGIFMLPKKKYDDIRKTRKRFMRQRLIYHHLDRKAREVYIEEKQYQRRHQQFLKESKKGVIKETVEEEEQNKYIKQLKIECAQSFKKLKDQSDIGDIFSRKIIDKLQVRDICNAIFSMEDPRKNNSAENRYPSIIDVLRSQSELLQSPVVNNIASCQDVSQSKQEK